METIERIKVSSIVNQAGTADLGNSDPKIAQSGNGQEPANEATKEQTVRPFLLTRRDSELTMTEV